MHQFAQPVKAAFKDAEMGLISPLFYLSFLFHASLGIQRGHGSECPLPWTQIEPSHIEMIEYHCLKCWLLWIRARWFSQCLTDTKPGASVTETNILSFMGGYDVISHTPHEHHHSDRIFGQRPKCDFSSFLSFFLTEASIWMKSEDCYRATHSRRDWKIIVNKDWSKLKHIVLLSRSCKTFPKQRSCETEYIFWSCV